MTYQEFMQLCSNLDKEADRMVGDGVVPQEDILMIAIKHIQLDAYKAGMTAAAEIVSIRRTVGELPMSSSHENTLCKLAILTARDNLKELPQ